MEVTVNTVQEGHWAITYTVMEKRMKARGPGNPQRSGRAVQSSASACKVDNWMWGWTREHFMGKVEGLVTPMLNTSLDVEDDAGDREHQGFLEILPEAHPLPEVEVRIGGVIKAQCA